MITRFTRPLIVTLTAFSGAAAAQEVLVASGPILGFYKFDVPVGTSLWTCGFVTKTVFHGKSTSITSGANSVLTVADANWGNFDRHYVEILSGPQTGLVLDIISNSSNSLTFQGNAAALGLASQETFCIRSHATLGKIFNGGAGLTAGSDTVTLIRETGTVSYTFNGGNWEDPEFGDATDVPIYPGEGFLISHNGSAPTTLTFGGGEVTYLKSGPTRIPLYAGIPNLVGLINPLVSDKPADSFFSTSFTALGDFGFEQSLGAGTDSVEIRLNNGSLTSDGVFTSNGSFMEDGNFEDSGGKPVRNGVGVIISVPADGTWTAPGL